MECPQTLANIGEKDYYATPYSAEIVNAFTNLMFMYLAYKGISSCFRYNHDTVFVVAFVGYLIVGTGSFFFHSTLKCKYFKHFWPFHYCRATLPQTLEKIRLTKSHPMFRSDAAGRRALNDLYNLHHVLRLLHPQQFTPAVRSLVHRTSVHLRLH